jgi:starvation-inducible DNA-binding protein
MENLNEIGLQKKSTAEIAGKLNDLLANYHIYYQNLRGFHWNIKGVHFFQLHAKFEELYTVALEKIDLIAERILTIGYTPLHTFSQYVERSTVKEALNISGDRETVSATRDNISTILDMEREIMELASESGDEGTLGLISEDVNQNEKTFWMLSAFLNE